MSECTQPCLAEQCTWPVARCSASANPGCVLRQGVMGNRREIHFLTGTLSVWDQPELTNHHNLVPNHSSSLLTGQKVFCISSPPIIMLVFERGIRIWNKGNPRFLSTFRTEFANLSYAFSSGYVGLHLELFETFIGWQKKCLTGELLDLHVRILQVCDSSECVDCSRE